MPFREAIDGSDSTIELTNQDTNMKEWRENNPGLPGNIRDYTDTLHLVVLSNLGALNANMINEGVLQRDNLKKLNNIAKEELIMLLHDKNIIGIFSSNCKVNLPQIVK